MRRKESPNGLQREEAFHPSLDQPGRRGQVHHVQVPQGREGVREGNARAVAFARRDRLIFKERNLLTQVLSLFPFAKITRPLFFTCHIVRERKDQNDHNLSPTYQGSELRQRDH